VDDGHLNLYKEKAPELLEAVTSGETAHVMRRDETSGYCVKFEGGLCGIQNKYGDDFLPDSCHFYPRITRRFGDEYYMSASLSCPEIARLAIYSEEPFAFVPTPIERLPGTLKDYLSDSGMAEDEAHQLFEKFISMAEDKDSPPERIISRISSLSRSLGCLPGKDWLAAFNSLAPNVDGRLPKPETAPSDPYNLLNILTGLVVSTHKPMNPRLGEVISSIERALGVKVNWQNMTIEQVENKSYTELREQYYRQLSPITTAPLRNWLKTELVGATFPFGGLGKTPMERSTIIAVRFATLKLAIMSNMQQMLATPKETLIFLAQSLARFLDHLAEPELSIACYEEAGWLNEARLRGLVGDG